MLMTSMMCNSFLTVCQKELQNFANFASSTDLMLPVESSNSFDTVSFAPTSIIPAHGCLGCFSQCRSPLLYCRSECWLAH